MDVPTHHRLVQADARQMSFVASNSVALVLTSPPYWHLKRFTSQPGQLSDIDDYKQFIVELAKVWREAYRVLVAGGRLVVVVGDVLLSRKRFGRHACIPLHSSIQVSCMDLGFDPLAPIFWCKIANIAHESGTGTPGLLPFLGKPYEPNGVIKHDVEYILSFRKPGGYRSPSVEQRARSKLSKEDFRLYFRQMWTDIKGMRASDRQGHPAPFPEELAYRLIRMFSFVDDIVLDPFCGIGSTTLAAMRAGRHSIGVELDPTYHAQACAQLCAMTNVYKEMQ